MKILVILPNLGGGGAEKVHISLANNWVKNGHEVTICSGLITPDSPFEIDKRINVIHLNCRKIRDLIFPLKKVIEGFIRDGRVGSSHTNVPGHDGKLGFGGSCFPKDIQALINFAEKNNLDLNVVKGAWKTNLEVRPEKDWEKLKGRAVID